jgi:hypothetical protein
MKAKKSKAEKRSQVATPTPLERPHVYTRDEVLAAYRHPKPEWHEWLNPEAPSTRDVAPAGARKLITAALDAGYLVKVQHYRGTTYPTWRVNLPESGGPPIDPSQYHGDTVEGIAVGIAHKTKGTAVATWHDGRLFHASVNGVSSGIGYLTEQVAGGAKLVAPTPKRKAS